MCFNSQQAECLSFDNKKKRWKHSKMKFSYVWRTEPKQHIIMQGKFPERFGLCAVLKYDLLYPHALQNAKLVLLTHGN